MYHRKLKMGFPCRASLTLEQWLVASSIPKNKHNRQCPHELLVLPSNSMSHPEILISECEPFFPQET
jgi:hypothetical protein